MNLAPTFNVVTVTQMLLWCTVIDYCLLILWWLIMILPHQWIYNLSGKPFGFTEDQFKRYNLAGIGLFKCTIVLFNLVPYIALRIVG